MCNDYLIEAPEMKTTEHIEQESTKKAFEESEVSFKLLFENNPLPMWVYDRETLAFLTINQAAIVHYGYSQEEFLSMTIKDIRPASDIPMLEHQVYRARPELLNCGYWKHRKKNGAIIDVEIITHDLIFMTRPARLALVYDITERKRAEDALRWAHDKLESQVAERTANLQAEIAERKRTEEDLRQAKEAAEAANRAKSEFLANMSHELRTPLNSILGYAQVLKNQDELPAKHRKALSIIEQSGEHLLRLINEILDLAKVEAGALELRAVDFNLPRLLQSVTDIMRARAQAKGLAFANEWFSDIPATVRADEHRLRQVLVNLLDNAIKYTHEGGVALKVGYHGPRLRFLVEDTGIGIRPEHLETIFSIFHQVHNYTAFEDGTGLGLAICKRLVNLMGGSLEVSSTAGEGSRFWFDLDLPAVTVLTVGSRPSSRKIFHIKGRRRKILIADDREDNRGVLRDMLVPLGFEVHEAADGADCLRQAKVLRPDVLLLDLRMPVLGGEEVIPRVRLMPRLKGLVIIVISARAFEHHREQCIEAGADDFLSKPFCLEKLLGILCHRLGLELVVEADGNEYAPRQECETPPEQTVLPSEQREALIELAKRGDIKRLREQAMRLVQLHQRYAPFAEALCTLAERFQIKKIRQLLETTQNEP